jgi:hypothetical protein
LASTNDRFVAGADLLEWWSHRARVFGRKRAHVCGKAGPDVIVCSEIPSASRLSMGSERAVERAASCPANGIIPPDTRARSEEELQKASKSPVVRVAWFLSPEFRRLSQDTREHQQREKCHDVMVAGGV